MGTVRDIDFKDVDLHIIALRVPCWPKIPEKNVDNNSNIAAYADEQCIVLNELVMVFVSRCF